MISDSVAYGGAGDLRLKIRAQDGRFDLEELRLQPPTRACDKPKTESRTYRYFSGES